MVKTVYLRCTYKVLQVFLASLSVVSSRIKQMLYDGPMTVTITTSCISMRASTIAMWMLARVQNTTPGSINSILTILVCSSSLSPSSPVCGLALAAGFDGGGLSFSTASALALGVHVAAVLLGVCMSDVAIWLLLVASGAVDTAVAAGFARLSAFNLASSSCPRHKMVVRLGLLSQLPD